MSYLKGEVMKADRLISILMLLQIHKQLTASELANRLEVSVRTIYRDIDSLSSMGIPIVTDRGNGGGIQLLGEYKTSLTGLKSDEIKYLVMSPSNKVLSDLGIEPPKQSTFLKLLSHASDKQIEEAQNIKDFIYIDMDHWNTSAPPIDLYVMSIIQDSIWSSNKLKILYRKINEKKEVILSPLGLVCKKGTWYLIGINSHIIKIYKVSSIEHASILKDTFIRPSDFNLEEYWRSSTLNFKKLIPKHLFKFKVSESCLNHVKERKFITIKNLDFRDDAIYIDIEFESLWQGIEFAFGYGKDVTVLYPEEAINLIKSKALEVIDLYT